MKAVDLHQDASLDDDALFSGRPRSASDESHLPVELVAQRLANDPVALCTLVEQHRLLGEAIAKSPVAYCVYDKDDRLIVANAAYEYLHPSLKGLRNLSHRDAPLYYADIVRNQLEGQVPDEELENAVAERVRAQRNADGTSIERDYGHRGYHRLTKFPLEGGGTAGIAFDITELKNREAELNTAKSNAERASHVAEEALMDERARKREGKLLSELSEWLQSCKSLDELFAVVSQFMEQMFPGSQGELYIYSNSRDVLDGSCEWNRGDALLSHIQPDDCWALRRGRMYKHGAGLMNFACAHTHDETEPPGSYVCLPIIAHGDTVGLLHIRFAAKMVDKEGQSVSPFEAGVHDFAIQCSEQISLAIANVKLRDELRDQSTRDPLTGLYNRRFLMEEFRREVARAERHGHPISLICLDADNFKQFNDSHGHDAGDIVLRAIAEAMVFRFDDREIVSRIGGEEFAILIPEVSPEKAFTLADELREAVEAINVRYGDKYLPKITISAGVSGYPVHGTAPQDLLRAADDALYRAKDSGRNAVHLAAALQTHATP